MISLHRIFPECCADTFLVSLLFQKEMVADYHGIGDVSNAMEKYFGDEFIIGLIDTDKFKRPDPKYLRNYTEILIDKRNEEGLIVLNMPGSNRHLIRLHPAFEKWIYAAAEICNINPSDYGFVAFEKFCKESKKTGVAQNNNVRNFIQAIIDNNPPAIQTLRFWLSKVL